MSIRNNRQRHVDLLCSFLLLCGAVLMLSRFQSIHSRYADAEPSRLPNIVLIMADDLGWKELGCYGQKKIETPHIDRLASEGMRFTQYYSGAPVCAPSRCNLLTGRHGGHAYIRNNGELEDPAPGRFGGQTPLPENTPGIGRTLQAAGYVTGCFGKWGLGGQGTSGDPLLQGFDRFFGYNCQRNAHNLYPAYLEDDNGILELEGNTRGVTGSRYAPALIGEKARAFVQENRDRPFFLYYATSLPHLALQVPEEDLARYRGRWPETPYTGNSYQPHDTPRACYAGMISFMDREVGRLMQVLDELGLRDDTIVLFTSDNGTSHVKNQVDYEFFESTGHLRGKKGSLYEGGIRVPMIVRWPGRVEAGSVSGHIGAHYDIPATLAEMGRTNFDRDSDGISMVPMLCGNPDAQQQHEFLFWDFAGYGGQTAVRLGDWKGVRRDVKKSPAAPMELYHLGRDPGETRNVAADHPDIEAKIRKVIARERTIPELERFRFGEY